MNENKFEIKPGGVVSYVVYNEIGNWYYSEIEKWIMLDWGQYGIDMTKDVALIGNEFFTKILSQDRVESKLLAQKIVSLNNEGKEMQAFFLKPLIYVDFDSKKLYSNYFDRPVERAILDEWEGSFTDVNKYIPSELQYWVDNELT